MANQQKGQTQTREASQIRTKTYYMVTSPHTPQECMQALDQIASQGQQALSQWKWACKSGNHTAYGIIQADTPEQALKMVPENIRSKARIEKVDEFTVDQIRDMHNK